eukprot:3911129-Pyramimonas_sp.AAC.1
MEARPSAVSKSTRGGWAKRWLAARPSKISLCLDLPFFQTKKDPMKSMGRVVYWSIPIPCRRRINR